MFATGRRAVGFKSRFRPYQGCDSRRSIPVGLANYSSSPSSRSSLALGAKRLAYLTRYAVAQRPSGACASCPKTRTERKARILEAFSIFAEGIVKLTLSERTYRVELISFALIGRHRLPPARR